MLKQFRIQNIVRRQALKFVDHHKARQNLKPALNAVYNIRMCFYEKISASFNKWILSALHYSRISPLVSTTYADIYIVNKIFSDIELRRGK